PFPTRRSSDLEDDRAGRLHGRRRDRADVVARRRRREEEREACEQPRRDDEDPQACARLAKERAQVGDAPRWREADHCCFSNRSYARTIRATSSWRMTSFSSKSTKAMPSTPRNISRARMRPDCWPCSRSIWVTSPFTTACEP